MKILDNIALWARSHSDKVLHFAVCLLLTLWISIICNWDGAVFIVFALSVIKEGFDRPYDRWDFVADLLGIAAAAVPLIIM